MLVERFYEAAVFKGSDQIQSKTLSELVLTAEQALKAGVRSLFFVTYQMDKFTIDRKRPPRAVQLGF